MTNYSCREEFLFDEAKALLLHYLEHCEGPIEDGFVHNLHKEYLGAMYAWGGEIETAIDVAARKMVRADRYSPGAARKFLMNMVETMAAGEDATDELREALVQFKLFWSDVGGAS